MKPFDNIEHELSALKQHYKVPSDYFENLPVKKIQPANKRTLLNTKKLWLAAAILVLLISLGYKIFNLSHQKAVNTILSTDQVTQNDDLFSDLSDEEIIDYLADEDLFDQDLQ